MTVVLVLLVYTFYDLRQTWLPEALKRNAAAMVGLPLGALLSLFVVVVLKTTTTGPVKFEAIGFKFEGAAVPVVLWLLCYLGISASIKLLWVDGSPSVSTPASSGTASVSVAPTTTTP
jgi:hypothetical protein